MILKETESKAAWSPLDIKAAEVTPHPAGGYTLSVPVVGSWVRVYLGQFASERLARNELARRECEG